MIPAGKRCNGAPPCRGAASSSASPASGPSTSAVATANPSDTAALGATRGDERFLDRIVAVVEMPVAPGQGGQDVSCLAPPQLGEIVAAVSRHCS